MLIFDRPGLVYLANPKTGTTSFEATFRPYSNMELSQVCGKHAGIKAVQSNLPDVFATRRFAICVRDPLETLYSWYRYRARPEIAGSQNSTRGITFEQFLDAWNGRNQPSFARVGSAVQAVAKARAALGPRLSMFRYENSEAMYQFFADQLGVSYTWRELNKSTKSTTGTVETLDSFRARLKEWRRLKRARRIYDGFEFVA